MPSARSDGQEQAQARTRLIRAPYIELFQATEKALPPLLSALGEASVLPSVSAMVILSSLKEEMVPDFDPSVTAAPDTFQVPKFVSGYTPKEPLGASAIHSALVLAQPDEQVCVVLKLLAGWVESATLSA